MADDYRIVYEGGKSEIAEKKSRFIAVVSPVESEEEALAFLERVRKEHWNASHHCFAYTVGVNREVVRCSDDKEPSGTAGKPMLDTLLGEELHNTAVVVARYFGGTLLGTGGLVRAYTKAAQEGLNCSRIITKHRGCLLEVETDYNGAGKLQYLFGQKELPVLDSKYTDKVVFQVLVLAKALEEIKKAVTEATNGRALATVKKELFFANMDKTNLLFDN